MNKTCIALLTMLVTACAGNRPPPTAAEPAPEPAIVTEEAPAAEPPARPEQTDNGRWRVSVISVRKAEDTAAMVKRLQGDGFRVETESAEAGGLDWHRVVLPGLRRFADAKQMVVYVQHAYGEYQAWILPREGTASAPAAAPAQSAPAEPPAD